MKILLRSLLVGLTLTAGAVSAQAVVTAPHELESGTLLSASRALPDFSFTRADGTSFTNADLKGKITLVYFGFTNCPGMCPTAMAQMATAYKKLQAENVQPLPQVVFVSIDPSRDDVNALKAFTTKFNPVFIGVRTDDPAMLKNMMHATSAMAEEITSGPLLAKDRQPGATHTMTHSGNFAVIGPDERLIAFLTMPHTATQMVADYKAILKNVAQK